MARKHRVWYPGAIFHITARGIRQEPLFYDKFDFTSYLDFLLRAKEEIPFILHAYCLMTNHIHLLIETLDSPPGDIIQFSHSRYAIYFNKRHKLTGHVFQGRYYSKLIDSSKYFLEASRYIHLNPLEAGIVEKPEHYYWSSYSVYLGALDSVGIVKTEMTLAMFPSPPEEEYRKYVVRKRGLAPKS